MALRSDPTHTYISGPPFCSHAVDEDGLQTFENIGDHENRRSNGGIGLGPTIEPEVGHGSIIRKKHL